MEAAALPPALQPQYRRMRLRRSTPPKGPARDVPGLALPNNPSRTVSNEQKEVAHAV